MNLAETIVFIVVLVVIILSLLLFVMSRPPKNLSEPRTSRRRMARLRGRRGAPRGTPGAGSSR